MIIGISGKSGSGKSSIANDLVNYFNYYLIDVDKLSKKIREENYKEIELLVGKSIFSNGDDSKELGKVLFEDKVLMKKYNEFIYEKLKGVIEKIISERKDIVIETMFLPIMDIFKDCDCTILVICDDEIRKERVLKRDKIKEEYFISRDKHSLVYNQNDFDIVVDTSDGYDINDILKKIN